MTGLGTRYIFFFQLKLLLFVFALEDSVLELLTLEYKVLGDLFLIDENFGEQIALQAQFGAFLLDAALGQAHCAIRGVHFSDAFTQRSRLFILLNT